MTTTTESRPTALPVPPCPPWCSFKPGHNDNVFTLDDANCYSVDRRVFLSQENMAQVGDNEWVVQDLRVYAGREWHGLTRVHVGKGDNAGVYLTLAEARELAEALLATVAEVEGTEA